MRPMDEVSLALLAAARKLVTPDRAPTMSELAAAAGVAQGVARYTVQNLKRAGTLCIVRERKVERRNRPVAEYAPTTSGAVCDTRAELRNVLSLWVQR